MNKVGRAILYYYLWYVLFEKWFRIEQYLKSFKNKKSPALAELRTRGGTWTCLPAGRPARTLLPTGFYLNYKIELLFCIQMLKLHRKIGMRLSYDEIVINKKPLISQRLCTRGGTWTRTDITAHRILSPACLPIPPPGRPKKSKHGFDTVPGTMSERRDSNPRPQPWQGCALPAELLSHFLPVYRSGVQIYEAAGNAPNISAKKIR